jgi:alpha-tubulin suppressor-like RCC1 family protein
VRQDGTLWAWGQNDHGQLGLGTTTNQSAPTPVGTITTWASVSAGYGHTLALRQDGTLWAWGLNGYGQLGLGTRTDQRTPAQVGTATTWRSLAVGSTHSLALDQAGSLWAWGFNYYGQLGTGATTSQAAPTEVAGGGTWQSLAAGAGHTVALRPDGSLWAWGFNNYGQLGNNSAVNPLPIYIPTGGQLLATTPTNLLSEWQLFPNPAHDQVQLRGLPAGPVAVMLFDSQGRRLRTTTTATVALAALAPGLYLMRATAGGATRTLRLVVE